MVREVARAALPRSIAVQGGTHSVPAPPVSTALLLVALAPGVEASVDEDVALWRGTLAAWLPEALANALASVAEEDRWALERQVVAALLFEGAPGQRAAVAKYLGAGKGKPAADLLAAMVDFDAADAVARVASTFHTSPVDVLAWPWPSFLLWLREAGRVRAQADLATLSVRGLPYIKDETDRRRVLNRMHVLAGARDEEAARTKEERIAHADAEMERLKRAMGVAGTDSL